MSDDKAKGHTALPWATHTVNGNADPNGVYHSAFRITALGGDFRIANSPNYTDDTRAQNEANAALIVRAVNLHDDAMRALVKSAVVLSGNATTKNALTDALESVRDVLARAKEQTP